MNITVIITTCEDQVIFSINGKVKRLRISPEMCVMFGFEVELEGKAYIAVPAPNSLGYDQYLKVVNRFYSEAVDLEQSMYTLSVGAKHDVLDYMGAVNERYGV